MKVTFICLLTFLGLNVLSQDTIPPALHIQETGDSVRLSATLRPLRQIAGAPSAFYSYFWELGDGHFSFDKEPVYSYHDTGTFDIRLYATNNYDDGKAPPTRPRKVRIKKRSVSKDAWVSHFFHGGGDVGLKINRYPKPGEDFVAIVGYRNPYQDSLSGNIVLFYNDRQLERQGFSLAEQRVYHGEAKGDLASLTARVDRQALHEELAFDAPAHGPMVGAAGVPDDGRASGDGLPVYASETQSMLHSLEDNYSSHTVVHFHSISRGTEQFVFMDMNTLPAMIRDTNATVGLSVMLVPDDPALPPQLYALDMQVVSSHDPNRMMLRSRRINYRFFKQKKELLYRVEFQNTGRGPARHISVGLAIPPQLDPESIRLNAMKPVCKWCDSVYARASCIDTIRRDDSIYFVFDNIYLPGIQQEGVGDKDSTMGFVEYAVRFKRKPKKIPFSTQAAIAFDRQGPLLTNKATARFIKGLSPGIMVGYSVLPGNGGYTASGPLQFGYVLAPYSPFRPYFQVEAFVGLLQQDAFTSTVIKDNSDTLIGGLPFIITGRQTRTTVNRNSFELTPLHFRYNLGKYFGIGAGAMAQINVSEQTTVENRAYFVTNLLSQDVRTAVSTTRSAITYLGSINAAPFIDLQAGAVRHGPVIGVRYMRLLKGDVTNRFWLYAGFKL